MIRDWLPSCKDSSYCAVGNLLLGDLAGCLACLRRWPHTAAELLRESQGGGAIRNRRPGVLAPLLGGSASVKSAVAAAAALVPTGELSVLNVHICGDVCAGKSMTKQALMRTLNLRVPPLLSSRLPTINRESDGGGTMGLESLAVDLGPSVRCLLHDYGGHTEFQANHGRHLGIPNSVYVIVVPLFCVPDPGMHPPEKQRRVYEVREVQSKYRYWLRMLYTVVPSARVKCITVVNFVRHVPSASLQGYLAALQAVQPSFASKLEFVGAGAAGNLICVDSDDPLQVHRQLCPVIKEAVRSLEESPVLVSLCVAAGPSPRLLGARSCQRGTWTLGCVSVWLGWLCGLGMGWLQIAMRSELAWMR